ncbi:MAG: pantoate--beta-alanine ligase [Lysobacterales bacterium CG02_land_8_20_14_3_00_62_12]
MMRRVTTIAELRDQLRRWRQADQHIALVPTMGNLHAGHYALVDAAVASADQVVVSVFVNPTQFGPKEDFARYPRTLDADAEGLQQHGCGLMFCPDVATMYPAAALGQASVNVQVPGLSEILCGQSRPGHFDGVTTVVTKLLNLVQPDLALFGQKDYQQWLLIRQLVSDLHLPVALQRVATVRAASGLALSSRNQYLSAAERETAAEIFRTLETMRAAVASGRPSALVEMAAAERLQAIGFQVDYVAIRSADRLQVLPETASEPLIGLIAARLGATRLIDNLLF